MITGPKSHVASSVFSFVSSFLCVLIAIPHPAGQFFLFASLFSGHDPSVYSLISTSSVCGSSGSSLVLSFLHVGSVFLNFDHSSFGMVFAADAYVLMKSFCS